jgi:nucleotide-binding universal stress UspA family protein
MTATVRRILVGVDGSANGRRALEWAMALAAAFDAEIVAVHAVGLLTHLDGGPAVPSHSHLDEMRRALETDWCAPLAASGLPHRLELLDGAPVPVLLGAAAHEAADLIVVGTRGAGGSAEVALGSTSHQLAEHADCPVVIVPPHRPVPGSEMTSGPNRAEDPVQFGVGEGA